MRVIFGEFVCKKQLTDFIIGNLSYHVFLFEFLQWLCGHVHVVINNYCNSNIYDIGNFNIGEFSEKSPILIPRQ